MSHPRFYHSDALKVNDNVKLTESAARHAAVLRLKAGDEIVLFNNGSAYEAKIAEKGYATIFKKQERDIESPVYIHLGQALSKGEKMEWVIQKAVELGVNEITPLITEHCAVKTKNTKHARWEGIIISACEQSGRNHIPILNPAQALSTWLEKHKGGLILNPLATQKLSEIKNTQKSISLVIGPEGGFSTQEIKLAEKNGCQSVRLGARILRTETAAIAAVAVAQSCWGDF